jgi:ribosome modulation factor
MSIDITKTVAPKSDQLNADDLIAGPRTITVTRVTGSENDEQPVSIYFEGDKGKPYKPGLSMRRVLLLVWGPDASQYAGRSMTLYTDPEVMFGGFKVGGIRISHMSHISAPRDLMLTAKRGRKNQYTVHPLQAETPDAAIEQAMDAAKGGKEAFTAFYNSDLGKKFRPLIKERLPEFQKIASDADEANKPEPNLAQRLAATTPPEDEQKADTVDPHWTTTVSTSDAFPGSPVWDEGVQAFGLGDPREGCPYAEDEEAAADWLGGWDMAAAPQEG